MAYLIRTRRIFLLVIASPLIAMLTAELVQNTSVRLAWNSAIENGSAGPAADHEPLCHTEPPYTSVPNWAQKTEENPFARLAKMEWQQELRNQDVSNLKDAEFAYRLRIFPYFRHAVLPNTKLRRIYLTVSSDKVTYRSIRLPNTGNMIFFQPGTATPVGYAGDIGECLFGAEDAPEERCDYYRDQKLQIHGFAWPGESERSQSPRQLSQERIRPDSTDSIRWCIAKKTETSHSLVQTASAFLTDKTPEAESAAGPGRSASMSVISNPPICPTTFRRPRLSIHTGRPTSRSRFAP